MTFYRLGGQMREISLDEISDEFITAGYIKSDELTNVYEKFGFGLETVEACQKANPLFRTDVEVHDSYTFTELRIVTGDGDDWIAVYLMKNLILIIDITDKDGSTRSGFINSAKRFTGSKLKFEKTVCSFIESLISGDNKTIEKMRNDISDMEELVVTGSADSDFNIELLEQKKKLLKRHNYYEQIIDVIETLEENDNDIFDDDNIIYISNLSNKVMRLKDDVDSLSNYVDHLQDAYSSFLDMKLNHTMKIFTVVTTIFFPLTIIVGWYGMNFQSMPEFAWKYGYLYVILLSAAVITVLMLIAKKRKWF